MYLFFIFLWYVCCFCVDLVLTPEADARRVDVLKQSVNAGIEELANLTKNESVLQDKKASDKELLEIYRSGDKMASLDSVMKSRMNAITSDTIATCLPSGQRKPFPINNLALMIVSGAKGSSVNSSQISCLLGQQELEGRRVPVMS
eukprot:Pgem_evm1s11775